MYKIKVDSDREFSPQFRLIQDLVDARKRGVNVTVWLDMSDPPDEVKGDNEGETNDKAIEILKKAGIQVSLVKPPRRLHAKVIVIDNRIVVEGSANWTYSALRRNAESSTLIMSSTYAAMKTARIIEEIGRNPVESKRSSRGKKRK